MGNLIAHMSVGKYSMENHRELQSTCLEHLGLMSSCGETIWEGGHMLERIYVDLCN